MTKNISILLTGIATSFFFFPFQFKFFPIGNTKIIMALVGIVFVALQMMKHRSLDISTDFLKICIWAIAFSSICLHSVVYNNTLDYAYAPYIISMLTWFSAAYAVCYMIEWTHKDINFRLLSNYLIGICVIQCLLALLIDFSLPFKSFVDSYINQDADFLTDIKRIYGIGASVDVAGTRFASVLVLLMAIICTDRQIQSNRVAIVIYIISFAIIATVGNMVARTTSVGVIVALVYLVYGSRIIRLQIRKSDLLLWKWIVGVLGVIILLTIVLYNYNEKIHDLLRFGFEGFFNWVEHGKWETKSTDHLRTMWIFPETTKTWLWGDGYFNHPTMTDADFVGSKPHNGFYMNTDIGYLRFIYYCGLPGLLVFCFFLFYMAVLCYRKYRTERMVFVFLFLLQLMIFGKVATDLFLVYAYFFAANIQQKWRSFKSLQV